MLVIPEALTQVDPIWEFQLLKFQLEEKIQLVILHFFLLPFVILKLVTRQVCI